MSRSLPVMLSMLLVTAAIPMALASDLPVGTGDVASEEYRVGPGDELQIEVRNEPDLTAKMQVTQNGTVSMYLLGEISVAGMSADEIRRSLQERLARDYLVNPQVTVDVVTFASQPVQVLGAARNPGRFALKGPTTVLEMLALAGGVDSEKSAKEIQIRRLGVQDAMVIGLDALISLGEGNVLLQAGDVLYVAEGQVVYVSGEVEKPGPVSYRDGLTISQALNEAGGTTPVARLRKAYVLRDGTRIVVNLKRIMQGSDPDLDLEVGDQISVQQALF